MTASWQVRTSVLGLQLVDGMFSVPSAEVVFYARFRPQDTGAAVPIIDEAVVQRLGLAFERFPCDLRLTVRAADPVAPKLQLQLFARTGRGEFAIGIEDAIAYGHVVLANTWVAIAAHHLEQLATLVALLGPSALSGITLRQLLQLRLTSVPGGILDVSSEVSPAPSERTSAVADATASQLEALLYPYQRSGVAWLRRLSDQEIGGILADEMGLGKTIQLISLIEARRLAGAGPVLILGTTSILENWRRELRRFAPALTVLVHHGSSRTGSPNTLCSVDVVIVSYDTLVRDSLLLGQLQWDLLIADEAQFLKNPATLRAQSARHIRCRQAIASTGTPVENSLRDLWSLTDLVVPGLLSDQATFVASFPDEPTAAMRLAAITAPIVLRRRVSEVAADLPPRIDIPTALVFSDTEASAYEDLRSSLLSKGAGAPLAALMRLRQFCAHPMLLQDSKDTDPAVASMKYSRLLELFADILAVEEKVLIFGSFTELLDLIRCDLTRRFGVHAAVIDGRMPAAARQEAIDAFSAVKGCAVLALNPRAAGAGLNIAAANHVIHYTLEWNPAVEDQASARAHRRGQTRPVTVHRLFYVDSVEEVMNDRLQSKRALISHALTDTGEDVPTTADMMAALNRSPRRVAPFASES